MTASVSSAGDRQLLRRPFVKQPTHPVVQLGPGDDLEAAGHLDQLQAAAVAVEAGANGLDRRLHDLERAVVDQLDDRLRRQWFGRREDERFDDRLDVGGGAVGRRFSSRFGGGGPELREDRGLGVRRRGGRRVDWDAGRTRVASSKNRVTPRSDCSPRWDAARRPALPAGRRGCRRTGWSGSRAPA